ncbi:protein Rf1, mitochondrial-like isoform X2 [Iris pallida]|uniref:Protein Rf1, mitochondrial-like isoform X2 n=1 Tax=Iris pallida TaxID=29817 RepID=A0AAX6ICX8_IRIPA|nr:protein Rf1, mitochondrial-like isoform X2 [Iris pallida]
MGAISANFFPPSPNNSRAPLPSLLRCTPIRNPRSQTLKFVAFAEELMNPTASSSSSSLSNARYFHGNVERLVRERCRSEKNHLSIEEALHLFDKLTAVKHPIPDVSTYNILFASITRKNNPPTTSSSNFFPTIFSLLNMLNRSGTSPDTVTYGIFIDFCGRSNNVDLALNGLTMLTKCENLQFSFT